MYCAVLHLGTLLSGSYLTGASNVCATANRANGDTGFWQFCEKRFDLAALVTLLDVFDTLVAQRSTLHTGAVHSSCLSLVCQAGLAPQRSRWFGFRRCLVHL